MPRPSTYSPKLCDHAVRMVFEHAHEYPSQWATIRSIAEKLGVPEGLRRWVRRAERDRGERPGLTTGERQRMKPLERENVELKREAAAPRDPVAPDATPIVGDGRSHRGGACRS
jgi:transposase